MKNHKKGILTAGGLCAFLLGLFRPAYADAGVPMLAVVWPASWLLLIPVIAVEAWIARRILGRSMKQNLIASASANASSTFIGLPLAWGLLAGVEIAATQGGRAYGLETFWGKVLAVTLEAPWLIPYESDLHWMVPAAAMVLLVPFFFMSVFIEGWLFAKVAHCSKASAIRWSWIANGVTYGFILAALAVLLIFVRLQGR